jgi:hypothetical protein
MGTYADKLRNFFFLHIVDYPAFTGPSVVCRDRNVFSTVCAYETVLKLSPTTVQSLTYPDAVLLTIQDPFVKPHRNDGIDSHSDMRSGNVVSLDNGSSKCIKSWNLYTYSGTLEDVIREIFPTGDDLARKKEEQSRIRLTIEEEARRKQEQDSVTKQRIEEIIQPLLTQFCSSVCTNLRGASLQEASVPFLGDMCFYIRTESYRRLSAELRTGASVQSELNPATLQRIDQFLRD